MEIGWSAGPSVSRTLITIESIPLADTSNELQLVDVLEVQDLRGAVGEVELDLRRPPEAHEVLGAAVVDDEEHQVDLLLERHGERRELVGAPPLAERVLVPQVRRRVIGQRVAAAPRSTVGVTTAALGATVLRMLSRICCGPPANTPFTTPRTDGIADVAEDADEHDEAEQPRTRPMLLTPAATAPPKPFGLGLVEPFCIESMRSPAAYCLGCFGRRRRSAGTRAASVSATILASTRLVPHRRQNLRVGSLGSLQALQIRSPGWATRCGTVATGLLWPVDDVLRLAVRRDALVAGSGGPSDRLGRGAGGACGPRRGGRAAAALRGGRDAAGGSAGAGGAGGGGGGVAGAATAARIAGAEAAAPRRWGTAAGLPSRAGPPGSIGGGTMRGGRRRGGDGGDGGRRLAVERRRRCGVGPAPSAAVPATRVLESFFDGPPRRAFGAGGGAGITGASGSGS